MRKRMIQEKFPDIEVYYIDDTRYDDVWSKNLDREIQKWIKPHQTVMLYGSRDSFISCYTGKFPTKELESTYFISGTEVRRKIANNFPPSREFRAGMIASTFNRYPTSLTTVDVAIIDFDTKPNRILLGKKKDEPHPRFIGGFTSPTSPSLEADARREVAEETGGIEIENIRYVGSTLIDDWRYRKEIDKIKTVLFTAHYIFGRPVAGDDIESVMWVPLFDLLDGKVKVMEEHEVLVEMLKNQFNERPEINKN
jgi:bifunctional NMN adenylyltransferase/nudix hydrolase